MFEFVPCLRDPGNMPASSDQCSYQVHLPAFNGRSTESAANNIQDSSFVSPDNLTKSDSATVIDSQIAASCLFNSPYLNNIHPNTETNASIQKLDLNENAKEHCDSKATSADATNDAPDKCNVVQNIGQDCQPDKPKNAKKTGGTVRRRRLKSGLDMIRSTRRRTPAKQNKCKIPKTNEQTPIKELRFDVKRFIVNKSLGETLLHRSARNNRMDIVKLCLDSGFCDVDVRDNAGYTPLHECSSRGNLQVARLLLEHSADANAGAIGGIRPLHDAIENDHIEMVRLLLSYGADPGLLTYSGSTLLQLSCSKAMTKFLNGFYNDISTERPDSKHQGSNHILSWKFGNQNLIETGFDIFDGVPAEEEEEKVHEDNVLVEYSDKPLLPLYTLLSRPDRPFYLLRDVLQFVGLDQEQFSRQHSTIEVSTLNKEDIVRASRCAQLQQRIVKPDLFQSSLANVIYRDDNINHILSIRTTLISHH